MELMNGDRILKQRITDGFAIYLAVCCLWPFAVAQDATLTVAGGQISAERILWTGGGAGASGDLAFLSGLIRVESSIPNVNAGPAANLKSGSSSLLSSTSQLSLSGNAVFRSQRLSLNDGGWVILDDDAVLDITGSVIEATPGSGQISDSHPTFDFTEQFLNGFWSQVQGQILFRNAGTGVPGQGPLIRVPGQSEVLSDGVDNVTINFEELLLDAIANEKVATDVPGGIFRVEWDGTFTKLWLTVPQGSISGSFVFHAGWNGGIEESIVAGKLLAKEGQGPRILSFDNVVNSTQGINGVVFEIDGLGNPDGLASNDFRFQVSPTGAFNETTNPVGNWQPAPQPATISLVPGFPDRVLILWEDQSIMNRWLRITIFANANTDLPVDEVYYVGHLLGETTGESTGAAYIVQFDDIIAIRNNIGMVVDSSSNVDIDKNGIVTFTDITAMRPNIGAALTNITIP
jgi:hypothetical protein